jgi:hypothetical protein
VHLVDAKLIETTEEVNSNCYSCVVALESHEEKAKSDVVVAIGSRLAQKRPYIMMQ